MNQTPSPGFRRAAGRRAAAAGALREGPLADRPRGARRSLHAARPAARRPLRRRGRAVRRSGPGGERRTRQGDRPLRSGARDGVLDLRRPHDPRRAQAALPGPGLVGARPPRRTGADPEGGAGDGGAAGEARATRRPSRRSAERIQATRRGGAGGDARLPGPPRRLARRDLLDGRRRRARAARATGSARRTSSFDTVEYGEAIGPVLEEISERDRKVLHLRFVEDMTQSEIADQVGVSQMHVSRILRATIEKLGSGYPTRSRTERPGGRYASPRTPGTPRPRPRGSPLR